MEVFVLGMLLVLLLKFVLNSVEREHYTLQMAEPRRKRYRVQRKRLPRQFL